VLGPVLLLEVVRTMPIAPTLAVMLTGLVALTLWLLPIVKGAFVGAQWAVRDDGTQ